MALAVIAVLSYLLFVGPLQRGEGARVTLSSEPAGATVSFNGQPLPQLTPCTLPPAPPGTYSLTVSKPGYLDHRTTVRVPAEGSKDLGVLVLQPNRRDDSAAPLGQSPRPP